MPAPIWVRPSVRSHSMNEIWCARSVIFAKPVKPALPVSTTGSATAAHGRPAATNGASASRFAPHHATIRPRPTTRPANATTAGPTPANGAVAFHVVSSAATTTTAAKPIGSTSTPGNGSPPARAAARPRDASHATSRPQPSDRTQSSAGTSNQLSRKSLTADRERPTASKEALGRARERGRGRAV